MGQKTHPIGFRLGPTRTWSSRWFATKAYAALLHEDVKIRRFIKDQLYHAGIAKIDIERSANRARITISTARPGIIIGRKGSEVEKLKNELQARTGKEIYLNIEEVIHPELDAQLVAENVALQLQKRVAFRRAMKKAVTSALRLGADGIRIACAGRLGGGEIARKEWYRDGPHDLRDDRCEGLDLQGRSAARRAGGSVRELSRADAQARQVPEGPAGADEGDRAARRDARVRRVWTEGARAGLGDEPADRGGARRALAEPQTRRQDLDPDLPRQARDEEAGRDPDGQGQGQPGGVGGRRETRADHLRDAGRAGGRGARGVPDGRAEDGHRDEVRDAHPDALMAARAGTAPLARHAGRAFEERRR